MLLNMVMVSAVVIAAFTVIFIIIYSQEHDARRAKLLSGAIPQTIIAGTSFGQESLLQVEPGAYGSVISGGATVSGFARLIEPGEGLSFSLIVDGDGNLVEVNSVVNLPDTAYGLAALEMSEREGRGETVELEGRTWQYAVTSVSIAFQETDGITLMVPGEFSDIRFLDVTDSDRMLESLGITLSGLTIVILAAIFIISRFFANRAIRPMQEAFDKQGRFIADASHELKTPLSIIDANCGALRVNEDETVASQIKWIDNITRAAGRMAGLTEALLSLTRIGDTGYELVAARVDLSEVVASAVSDFEQQASEKGLVINTDIGLDIEVESDREQIIRILSVLMDNAIKFSDNGGEIAVLLRKERHRAVCSVSNSGNGIEQKDIPRLFDRFYRADPSRSSETGGYGLGLSIAKAAADRLGAALTVKSEPGRCTEFSLIL